jgi:YD repeat-containing protein
MSWNHRVVSYTDAEGTTHFGIHEVYYDESGRPTMYTESAMSPYGESLEELRIDLERMRAALEEPVLTDDDFKKT